MKTHHWLTLACIACLAVRAAAADLAGLDPTVVPAGSELAGKLPQMLSDDYRARRTAVNLADLEAWRAVQDRAGWERFRDPRIQALRDSLGQYPPPPDELPVRVTRTIDGDGYRIENLVFASRPGLVVTANLYLPAKRPASMPGILIVHSHHNPKTQGELQDMGILWARLGCAVLVMDQLGHGERRQHPFVNEASYPTAYRVTRQDYYFRYVSALQLHAIGDSLIGWMAYDLMRGVDLLRNRQGADPKRILLLGAVAGGGDPAAVTAALEPRITGVVPFNFGGPQPETVFPLPADAERSFNYLGGGSWESTRNLRLAGRDGFFPWVVVGSVAPRYLIYAHEFAWDRDRDPVWKRFETIYGFYGARDHLGVAHGSGSVKGKPPESTHCNNIGAVHRKPIYPLLERWFGIPQPAEEPQERRSAEELQCLTPAVARELQSRPLVELAAEIGGERAAAARRKLESLAPAAQRQQLRQDWARLLGNVEPGADAQVLHSATERRGPVAVHKLALQVEPGIVVPLVLLEPARPAGGGRLPVVVAFAQEGKKALLDRRGEVVSALLDRQTAVCLVDLRGCGETRLSDAGRGRNSSATSLSAGELMLGQTLLGSRLRDLRAVLAYLRTRPELDGRRVGLWGDSLAAPNPPDKNLVMPLDSDPLGQAEPLGGLLALLGALYDDGVTAVYGRGGLASYQAMLVGPMCYLPHDAVVPGAMTVGDLSALAAALAPRPLRLEGLVDGYNRLVPDDRLAQVYAPAVGAYARAAAANRLRVGGREDVAGWLLANLAAP